MAGMTKRARAERRSGDRFWVADGAREQSRGRTRGFALARVGVEEETRRDWGVSARRVDKVSQFGSIGE